MPLKGTGCIPPSIDKLLKARIDDLMSRVPQITMDDLLDTSNPWWDTDKWIKLHEAVERALAQPQLYPMPNGTYQVGIDTACPPEDEPDFAAITREVARG